MVYLETGIRTEWSPHKVGDTEKPVTTKLPPVNTQLPPVTKDLPPVATKLPPMATEFPVTTKLPPVATQLPPVATDLPPVTSKAKNKIGRPTRPIVCPACKRVFKNIHKKSNHFRRGKCIVTTAST